MHLPPLSENASPLPDLKVTRVDNTTLGSTIVFLALKIRKATSIAWIPFVSLLQKAMHTAHNLARAERGCMAWPNISSPRQSDPDYHGLRY